MYLQNESIVFIPPYSLNIWQSWYSAHRCFMLSMVSLENENTNIWRFVHTFLSARYRIFSITHLVFPLPATESRTVSSLLVQKSYFTYCSYSGDNTFTNNCYWASNLLLADSVFIFLNNDFISLTLSNYDTGLLPQSAMQCLYTHDITGRIKIEYILTRRTDLLLVLIVSSSWEAV